MNALQYLNKSKKQLIEEFQSFYYNRACKLLPGYEFQRNKTKYDVYALNSMFIGLIMVFVAPFQAVVLIGTVLLFGGAFVLYFRNKGKKVIVIKDDYDLILKEKLMPEFLSIFGNFTWKKYLMNNYLEVLKKFRNLKIFPVSHFIVFDDIIQGEYGQIKLSIMETKSGFKAFNLISAFIYIIAVVAIVSGYFFISFITGALLVMIASAISEQVAGAVFFTTVFVVILVPVILIVVYATRAASVRCLVTEFDIPKKFKGNTCIYEKAASAQKLAFKSKKGMQPVVLEDVKFNNLYNIYSTDQIEARYLLTTAFIERFLNIKMAFKAEYIRAEFTDNKLILVIGVQKDLFAMGSISIKTTGKTFAALFEELYSVLSLVDTLKLDNKTGL